MFKLTVAAAGLFVVTLAVGASADPPGRYGASGCALASWNEPTGLVEPDWTVQTGAVAAAVALADAPQVRSTDPLDLYWHYKGNPAMGTLTCSIQVNSSTHPGIDVATVSATGTGVVALASPVTYRAGLTDLVYVCSRWTLTDAEGSSVTLYLNSSGWTTNSDTSCLVANRIGHGYWSGGWLF